MIAGARLAVVVSVLCYFVMSALISQTGVTSALMAAHFELEITTIVPLFSFLTGGVFAGVFISLFIFNFLAVRTVFLLCSGLVVLAAICNYLIDHAASVPFGFSVMGIAGGVGMSAAAVTIASTFDVRHRSSMLVGADLFYSAGGYLIIILVAGLASSGARWSAGYLAVGGVSLLIFFISLVARFPEAHDDPLADAGRVDLHSGIWKLGGCESGKSKSSGSQENRAHHFLHHGFYPSLVVARMGSAFRG